MKSGTGDDPFADDANTSDAADDRDATDDAEPEADADAPESAANSEDPTNNDAGANADESADRTTDADADGASGDDGDADTASEPDAASDDAPAIPWVLRRSSVKADRPNVTQFFLRDETDRAERRFQSDVEEILDADVYTLDLREAAYLVAMRHPDEVAEELRDWGYEYVE